MQPVLHREGVTVRADYFNHFRTQFTFSFNEGELIVSVARQKWRATRAWSEREFVHFSGATDAGSVAQQLLELQAVPPIRISAFEALTLVSRPGVAPADVIAGIKRSRESVACCDELCRVHLGTECRHGHPCALLRMGETIAQPKRLSKKELLAQEGLDPDELMEQLELWMCDGSCPAMCGEGCEVELDGRCQHGHPSCFIAWGLI